MQFLLLQRLLVPLLLLLLFLLYLLLLVMTLFLSILVHAGQGICGIVAFVVNLLASRYLFDLATYGGAKHMFWSAINPPIHPLAVY